MRIPISEIKINPERRKADPAHIKELSKSIADVGLLNPITVKEDHTLIAGLHRLEAAKLLYLKKNLTILTNDMRIALELSSNTDHTLYFIGGAIKKDDMITTGFLSNEFLDYFSHIDLAIIGTDGFNVNIGLTDYNVEMGTLKAAMIKKSSKVFVLADHSKFSVNAFYKVCGVDKIDLVVTSRKVPRESLEVLERQGAKTVIAPCGQP